MNLRDIDGIKQNAWAFKDLVGERQDHSPRSVIRSVSSSANVNPVDQLVVVTATATVTLPSAVGRQNLWHVLINTGSGTMTVACSGSETISGSSTLSTSVQNAGFFVFSDGTNWHAVRTDLASALGDLSLTTGVSGILPSSNGGVSTQPLVSYGGYKLDGTNNYLDGNALTGIADGKAGSFFVIVRFANAASATERIFDSTSNAISVFRSSTGNIQVVGENAAGTLILGLVTSGNPCAAAGTYVICSSWDLASAGTARIVVNDTPNISASQTYTNDTIDYTVAEYAVGASTTGTAKSTGDIYTVWFDPTQRLEWNTESVRRKFYDVNLVPEFLGRRGELPTGSVPLLFLGYDDHTLWPKNRGSAVSTTFTENGTPAAVTTALSGRFGDKLRQYPAFASASNLTPSGRGRYQVSGTTNIDLIAETNFLDGDEITLMFQGSLTVAHNTAASGANRPILLSGAANFSATANDQLTLQYDRDRNFYEVARTVI